MYPLTDQLHRIAKSEINFGFDFASESCGSILHADVSSISGLVSI